MKQNQIHSSRFKSEMSPHMGIHDTEDLTNKAKFFLSCIERWGMVQGVDNGEDSAGRHRLGLMTPGETVERAKQMAELAWDAMRGNSEYINVLPTYEQMKAAATKDKEEA